MTTAPEPNEEQQQNKYHKDDYDLDGWIEKISEEEAEWAKAGMNLNMMNFTGGEIFMLQCKLQAITNCALENDFSELNMNLHLKAIIVESMEAIRQNVAPQIARAKLMQGVHQQAHPEEMKRILMPWEKPHIPRGGNGGR